MWLSAIERLNAELVEASRALTKLEKSNTLISELEVHMAKERYRMAEHRIEEYYDKMEATCDGEFS